MHRAPFWTTLTALVVLLAAAAPAPVEAAGPPVEQLQPTLAFNEDPAHRDYLLVWVEDRGDGGNLYAKRLFHNGLAQGGPRRSGYRIVRDNSAFGFGEPANPRSDPALVFNEESGLRPGRNEQGEYLLAYSEYAGEDDGWDVKAVRVTASGFARGHPRTIAGGPGDQRRPDVAFIDPTFQDLYDGWYLVVWDDNTRDVDEVWGARVRANGIPIGDPHVIVREPSNASDPTTSGSAVAWVDDRNDNNDIYAVRIENGLPRGEHYPIGPAATVEDEYNPRYSPGGLLWNVFNAATGFDIRGTQIVANDRSRGGALEVLVPAANQQWPHFAAADRFGVMVFADDRSGEYDLYAIRTINNLRTRGREYAVHTDVPAQ